MATQAEIAGHLDMSPRRLRELYDAGVITRGAELDVQRREYINHLRRQAAGRAPTGELNPPQEKARLDRARTEKLDLELAAAKRELLPIEEFRDELADVAKAVARGLQSVPDRLERDCNLSGDAVDVVIEHIRNIRDEVAELIEGKPND